MIPFFSVTINEIVSEVIEAMKWVVDYAVENGSRYINNDFHQSKQIAIYIAIHIEAITNSNEVVFILIAVLRWRDIQLGANCVQWFCHQPGLRMHQPRLKASLRLETQLLYRDIDFYRSPLEEASC